MSFLEPLFLIGLLAASLPVIVHLMNRRKAVKVPFPALRLLHESNKRTARSLKVRQWLLMAARILGVLLLVFALAKPFVLSSQGLIEDDRLPAASVIVLDDSASMQAGEWWERAREAAIDHIDAARPWDEIAWISTTSDEMARDRPDDRHAEYRQEIEGHAVSQSKGDLGDALLRAASILKSSELPQRRIILITDAAHARPLLAHDLDRELLAQTEYVSVRGKGDQALTPKNLAVTAVRYEQDGGDATKWRISASVKNFSSSPMQDIELRLRIGDGGLTAARIAQIGAGEEIEQTFLHTQETQTSAHSSVELVSQDEYALDDTHHFIFRTRARISALLVNGETSSVADEDELFFLTRALNPARSTTEGIIPRVISQDGLLKEDLSAYDAVVLANVPRLSKGATSKLERYVAAGGGVLFTAGDQVDVDAYNSTLAELLPKPLRTVKEFATRDDPDAPVKVTRFGATNPRHPIFRAFDLPGGETLQSAEVYSAMLFDPAAVDGATTVLSFKDDSPALIEREVGEGRALFFATSVDMEWTTLPVRSAFVPLMQRAVEYLARRSSNLGEADLRVGEPVRLEVGGLEDERVVVRGPMRESEPDRLVLEPQDGLVALTPSRAGTYEVWAKSDDPAQGERLDDLAFAVNVPLEESNLEGVLGEEMRAWLDRQVAREGGRDGGPEGLPVAPLSREKRVNIWPKLLFLFTLILLAETILGTRRSLFNKLTRRGQLDEGG